LAYGIATLMTNLFGRGKEPFWQQASTNLVKFVILLHQTLDGYVTLFQVYEHVINPDKLRARIAEGERHSRAEHLFTDVLKGWAWHDDETGTRIVSARRTTAEYSRTLLLTALDQAAEHATESARRALSRRWPDIEVGIVDKTPTEGILGAAKSFQADVIVVGWRGHGAVRRLLMGSVSRGVVRLGAMSPSRPSNAVLRAPRVQPRTEVVKPILRMLPPRSWATERWPDSLNVTSEA
jgi:nucleotide-binding universal stress UspA family protein